MCQSVRKSHVVLLQTRINVVTLCCKQISTATHTHTHTIQWGNFKHCKTGKTPPRLSEQIVCNPGFFWLSSNTHPSHSDPAQTLLFQISHHRGVQVLSDITKKVKWPPLFYSFAAWISMKQQGRYIKKKPKCNLRRKCMGEIFWPLVSSHEQECLFLTLLTKISTPRLTITIKVTNNKSSQNNNSNNNKRHFFFCGFCISSLLNTGMPNRHYLQHHSPQPSPSREEKCDEVSEAGC